MGIKRQPTSQRKPVPMHTVFYVCVHRYQQTMLMRGFSESTISRRQFQLERFIRWCEERSLTQPQEITKPIVEAYQRYLFYSRDVHGRPLGLASQRLYLSTVKQFFKWLTQENYTPYNPASELILPKVNPSLPRVLSVQEINQLLACPNLKTTTGMRDRALLELLYSTGIRRMEVCNLQLGDLQRESRTLWIRKGKGGKDRVLPVGERAIYWLGIYLDSIRPQLVMDMKESALFINHFGQSFREKDLTERVKSYLAKAGIVCNGSCHLLRHAMATHMLENGADIRFIQAMLGHADLSTTQIYTHVNIEKLREVHRHTHPAKLEDKQALLTQLQLESEDDADS